MRAAQMLSALGGTIQMDSLPPLRHINFAKIQEMLTLLQRQICWLRCKTDHRSALLNGSRKGRHGPVTSNTPRRSS